MRPESRYEAANGLRLMVHRFRDATAPPSGLTVLLLHGYMDAGSTWDLVAAPLARAGHDVIAPDLRGFGGSDRVPPGGYYHFSDYVADVASLVDGLAPPRLAVIGHSMGGTVAALYAGALPGRVERLALLEGVGPMAGPASLAVDRARAWLRGLAKIDRTPPPLSGMDEAVKRLALNHPRIDRDLLRTRAERLSRTDEQGRLVWSYDPLHRTTAPTPFHAESFAAFLGQIRCPTLCVGGGALGWHPPDEAERIAAIRGAVTRELPDAGHMMHWTRPAELGAMLVDFLAETPQPKAGVEESRS